MDGYPRIEVTKGMAGWFAVKMWWNDEGPVGFPEPYSTGDGRYEMQCDAVDEGRAWAKHECLPFIEPEPDVVPARQDVVAQIQEIMPDIEVIHLEKPR
jgi:hypothetical protein